jgi:hypothetical protein
LASNFLRFGMSVSASDSRNGNLPATRRVDIGAEASLISRIRCNSKP